MSGAVSFPNALDGFFEELRLGKRGVEQKTTPDADECEHIAALLRRGATHGLGFVMWDLRTAPGVKLDQAAKDHVADCIVEAGFSGVVETVDEDGRPGMEAQWRLSVRR
jgi:hypothetical protein